jgi:hypothetical protein
MHEYDIRCLEITLKGNSVSYTGSSLEVNHASALYEQSSCRPQNEVYGQFLSRPNQSNRLPVADNYRYIISSPAFGTTNDVLVF